MLRHTLYYHHPPAPHLSPSHQSFKSVHNCHRLQSAVNRSSQCPGHQHTHRNTVATRVTPHTLQCHHHIHTASTRHISMMKRMSNKWLRMKQNQQPTNDNDADEQDDDNSDARSPQPTNTKQSSTPDTAKELTPMLKQWHDIKSRYSNYIILFRVGEFYEILYDDAITAANVLSITLTSRAGRDQSGSDIPMCGVPYFSVESYLSKLIKHGLLVAIVEQMVDMKAKGAGLMERQVTRLITPGTLIESSLLNPKFNNFLCSIVQTTDKSSQLGVAFVDVSTGQFYTITCTTSTLSHHIARIQPSEILVTKDTHQYIAQQVMNIRVTLRDDASFSRDIFLDLWHSMNNRDTVKDAATLTDEEERHRKHEMHAIEHQVGQFSRTELRAAGALLDYIRTTHQNTLPKLTLPRRQIVQEYMSIDAVTRRALELTNSISNPVSKQQTLLDCVDATVTPQGARLLSARLSLPLLDVERIHRRLDVIEYFTRDYNLLDSVRVVLRDCADVERAIQRVSLKRAGPRDLFSIKETIEHAKRIHSMVTENNTKRLRDNDNSDDHKMPKYLLVLLDTLQNDDLDELCNALDAAIKDPPPLSLDHGHFVNDGYSDDLDKLHAVREHGNAAVKDLQQKYRQALGIQSLKIKQNQQLLHYIEVSTPNKAKIDGMQNETAKQFVPIQSLKNVHRYKTNELSELQNDILTSDTQINELEKSIFDQLRLLTLSHSDALMKLAHSIAIIDLSFSNAKISVERNYCRPTILQQSDRVSHRFDIRAGRHAVVEERMMYDKITHTHSTKQPRGVATTMMNDAQLLDAQIEASAAQSAIAEVLPFMSILPLDVTNLSNKLLAEKLVKDNIDKADHVNTVSEFEPNDCVLEGDQRVWLLTGSNMSGKSTVLRQNALIAILAQSGLFVPATSATITIIDQIFCRVGASDDISNALSTFMVEMQETAHILTNATKNSLAIFDELGRGTSTRDGLALASSCLEYIHNTIECRAMFATHFTELAVLLPTLPYMKAMRTAIKKQGEQIIFLHQLEEGVSQQSYGLFVARLAGLPEPVLDRASELMERFDENAGQPLADSLIDERTKQAQAEAAKLEEQSEEAAEEMTESGKA